MVKRSKVRRLACFLLAAVMFTGLFVMDYSQPVAASSLQEDKNDYNNLKNKMDAINDRLKEINSQLSQAKADRASILKQKQLYDQQLAAIGEKLELSQQLIASCDNKIRETQQAVEALELLIQADYELIRQRLIFAQETGDLEYIDFLLGSSSLSDLLSRVEVMNDLFENDKKVLQALSTNKEQVEQKKRELEETRKQSEALRQDNLNQQAEFLSKQAEAEKLLKDLENDVDLMEKTKKEVQAAKNQLDDEMEALAKQIEEKENAVYTGGAFIWPVPAKYRRISQEYKGKSHTGIDIPTNSTAVNVFATASGKVVTAGWHWSYGNYVVIYHGSGMQSLYAHLSKIYVKVNQQVQQGHVIGLTGNTGYSFGVHLHFIIYENGSHTNPLKYVTQPS